jgi:hypothetical protein
VSEWYGIRCVFQHHDLRVAQATNVYEERIIVVRASSAEEAISQAEAEAAIYAADDSTSYLKFAQAFHAFEDSLDSPSEVFSLMRESELDADEYIDRFFDTGHERERKTT